MIIIGSGREDNIRLSPEAEDCFAKMGCEVLLQPTQQAIRSFNRSAKRKMALMHVTCRAQSAKAKHFDLSITFVA